MIMREIKLGVVLGSLVIATWIAYIAIVYMFVPYLNNFFITMIMIIILGAIFMIAKSMGNKIIAKFPQTEVKS